jgi:hypothetical protein
MSQTVQIKRRTTASGTPATLAPGELFYNFVDRTLLAGDANGAPQALISINRQVELAGNQFITGVKTMSLSNLRLTGGAANQFVKTDGNGNLAFAPVTPPIPATTAEMDAGTRNDVFGTPLNTRFLIGASVATLHTAAKTVVPAINELKSAIDQIGSGQTFVGSFDATASTISWTAASGASGNALPAPDPTNSGWQLICTVGGTAPPAGALAGTYFTNDWLLSDGTAWTHLMFGGTTSVIASSVSVSPAVAGGSNVQTALQGLETQIAAVPDATYIADQDALRVLKAGDTMTGALTMQDVPININKSVVTDYNLIYGQLNSVTQWRMDLGDSVGNFALHHFDDVGTFTGTAISINRTTGLITTAGQQVNGNINCTGAIAANGNVTSTAELGCAATIRFNNAGGYLSWSTDYVLQGGPLSVTSQIVKSNQFWMSGSLGNSIYFDGNNTVIRQGTASCSFQNSSGTQLGLLDSAGNFSVTGAGTFPGTVQSNAAVQAVQHVMAGSSGSVGYYHFGGSGTKYIVYDGANFSAVGGDFYVNGLHSAAITASGTISSASFINAGYTSDYGLIYFGNSSGRYLEQNGNQFTLVGGRLNVNSDIHATGNVLADGGNFFLSGSNALARAAPYTNIYTGGNIGLILGDNSEQSNYYRNSRHVFQSVAGGADFFSVNSSGCTSNGSLSAGGALYCHDTDFSNGCFISGGYGYQSGGGAWRDSSDVRIKNITGDYAHGLNEILKLQPRRFTYKGNDTFSEPSSLSDVDVAIGKSEANELVGLPYGNSPHHEAAMTGKEFIGLIAQEAEIVMPEMITKIAGYINGTKVADLRELNSTALIFALVNAVKTLAARVEALEAKT